jgi:hypothetical protein
MSLAAEETGAKHPEVQVELNYRRVRVPGHTTGLVIKERAGIDTTWSLFIVRGREETEVGNDTALDVHEGERFVSTPCLEPS